VGGERVDVGCLVGQGGAQAVCCKQASNGLMLLLTTDFNTGMMSWTSLWFRRCVFGWFYGTQQQEKEFLGGLKSKMLVR
jgi:hypothetical protein